MQRKQVEFGSLRTGQVFWYRPPLAWPTDPWRKWMVIFMPDSSYNAVCLEGKHKGRVSYRMIYEPVEVKA